jgi:hypothetical protein
MKKNATNQADRERVHDFVLEMLETELGGAELYRAALPSIREEGLRDEFEEYLSETEQHVEKVRELLAFFEIDSERETPGRQVVRELGRSLVEAVQSAREKGSPSSAEIVAAECVTLAETKDHLNWELLRLSGDAQRKVLEICESVEEDEDHHLYHTTGWTRELWIRELGMDAVLPPPEEVKDVKTAIGAARAKASRGR